MSSDNERPDRNANKPGSAGDSNSHLDNDTNLPTEFGRNRPDEPPPSPENHRRVGSSMYWAAAIVTLALLTLFFNNRIKHNEAVNGVTEKLMRQADGHYYSRGSINNQPVVFMLDTGASVVSIPAAIAARIGLPKLEPETAYTANGAVTVYNTRPITVRLRDIELHGVQAHINPGMDSEAILLGMSFLSRLDFRQRDKTLILKSRPEL